MTCFIPDGAVGRLDTADKLAAAVVVGTSSAVAAEFVGCCFAVGFAAVAVTAVDLRGQVGPHAWQAGRRCLKPANNNIKR